MGTLEQTVELLKLGARGVCIDIAHGHSEAMIRFITDLKKLMPEKEVIAGNVCTPMGYQDLVSAGADAVKVGVGCGAACQDFNSLRATRYVGKNNFFYN